MSGGQTERSKTGTEETIGTVDVTAIVIVVATEAVETIVATVGEMSETVDAVQMTDDGTIAPAVTVIAGEIAVVTDVIDLPV